MSRVYFLPVDDEAPGGREAVHCEEGPYMDMRGGNGPGPRPSSWVRSTFPFMPPGFIKCINK